MNRRAVTRSEPEESQVVSIFRLMGPKSRNTQSLSVSLEIL